MNYRKLGTTGIEVSVVALGCWSFGGGGPWGEQDDHDSIETVAAALDAGINFFDTAQGYGRSEEVLGAALKGRRNKAVIATKMNWNYMTAAGVAEACEASLRRLQTDCIDLYQIHWPNPAIPVEETLAAMVRLQEQGKVRAIGVSNFGPRQLACAVEAAPLQTNQVSYSLIWRAPEYALEPLCHERGLGIICWGPLSEGILTGKFRSADEVPATRRGTRYFSSSRSEAQHGEPGCEQLAFETLERIRAIAQEIGQPMAAVALAWPLHQRRVVSVLAGARRPEQIDENALAGSLSLSSDVLMKLDEATAPLKAKLGPNLDMYLPAEQSRIF